MITIYLKQYNKIVRNADVRLFDDLGYDDILWIDLLSPTIKEQKAVENFMEINLQTRQQVEEIESSSKYSETENAIICNSNFSCRPATRSASSPCRSSSPRACSCRCASTSSEPSPRALSGCR
ncbi:MAG: hypothetical protein ACLTTP_12395 [Alistipes ihumii]